MKRYAIILCLLLLAGFGCAKAPKPGANPSNGSATSSAAVKNDGADVDTDGDGLTDRDEVEIYESNPLLKDTDHDGVSDGEEVKNGDSPNGPGKLIKREAPKP
jgi:hypothetical protein